MRLPRLDELLDCLRGAAGRERARVCLGARGLAGSLPLAVRALEDAAPGGVRGARHSVVPGLGSEGAA